jgi:hypothetical protein
MFWMITGMNPEWADEEDMKSRIGVGHLPAGWKAQLKATAHEARAQLVEQWAQDERFTWEWKTHDDDDGLCYSGVCGDVSDAAEDLAFAPLDYSMADVGATMMFIRKKGETEWQML